MAEWNHLICDDCWEKRDPGREPHRIIGAKTDSCCFCGNPTLSSIWVRHDPKDPKLACKGTEGAHKEEIKESTEGSER
jgi:hypothetical protein